MRGVTVTKSRPCAPEYRRSNGLTSVEHDELRRLRRDNLQLCKGREIPRTEPRPGLAGRPARCREVFAFVKAKQTDHRVATMCLVLVVSGSGYCVWAAVRCAGARTARRHRDAGAGCVGAQIHGVTAKRTLGGGRDLHPNLGGLPVPGCGGLNPAELARPGSLPSTPSWIELDRGGKHLGVSRIKNLDAAYAQSRYRHTSHPSALAIFGAGIAVGINQVPFA